MSGATSKKGSKKASKQSSRKQTASNADVGITVSSGPLGPWRLCIAVGAAAVTTGMPLADVASNGGQLDMALGRSFGVAFVVWIAIGAINRVLAQVETARVLDAHAAASSAPEPVTVDA